MDTTEHENSLNQSLRKAIKEFLSDKKEIKVSNLDLAIATVGWVNVKPRLKNIDTADLLSGDTIELEVEFNCRLFEDQGDGNSRSRQIEGWVDMVQLKYRK